MRWEKPWLIGTLLVFVICSMSCGAKVRYLYRPTDERIFLVPAGTILDAGDKRIITDGPDGKMQLERLELPYSGILLSEGKFLQLVRDQHGMDNGS